MTTHAAAALLFLLMASMASASSLRGAVQQDAGTRQLLTITGPRHMTAIATTLTPFLRSTLKKVSRQFDPYTIEEPETSVQIFSDIKDSLACPDGTLDVKAEITVKQVLGLSSLFLDSLTIDSHDAKALQDTGIISWSGVFVEEGFFYIKPEVLVDVRLTGLTCGDQLDIEGKVANVKVLLDDLTLNPTLFLQGHADTTTSSVVVEAAEGKGLDFHVWKHTITGLEDVEALYVSNLSELVAPLIVSTVETSVASAIQNVMAEALSTDLPARL